MYIEGEGIFIDLVRKHKNGALLVCLGWGDKGSNRHNVESVSAMIVAFQHDGWVVEDNLVPDVTYNDITTGWREIHLPFTTDWSLTPGAATAQTRRAKKILRVFGYDNVKPRLLTLAECL